MNLPIILIVIFTIFFLGYPLVRKEGREEINLKGIDEYIEREVRALRRGDYLKSRPFTGKKESLVCPTCGRKYSPEDRFCISCGTKLKAN